MGSVLHRELLELARQNALYGLRMAGAGVMMVLLWLAWERASPGTTGSGRGFFLGLNRLLFAGIWLVGPVLTADCLSREKREGTLGLLFLTPLRAVDVVVGKAITQAARSFLFVLAAVPILIIPVLLGGIGWMDAARMLLFHLSALGLALVAGLAASSVTRSWWRARLLALGIAVGMAGLFLCVHLALRPLPMALSAVPGHRLRLLWAGFRGGLREVAARMGIGQRDGFDAWWMDWGGPASGLAVALAGVVCLASMLGAILMVLAAAAGVKRTWRDEPASARRRAAEEALLSVRFGRGWWTRRRRRQLDANPARWMQSRTWDARLSAWLMAGAVLAGWGMARDADGRLGDGFISLLRPMFLGLLAFMATASFRAERESGGLELWLVTPLTPGAILRGRFTALLLRVSIACALLVLLPYLPSLVQWAVGLELSIGRRQWLAQRVLGDLDFALWVAATAMMGTAMSLSRLSFVPAFGITWVLHYAPYLVSAIYHWYSWHANGGENQMVLPPSVLEAREIFRWAGPVGAALVLIWSWRFGLRQLARRRYLPGIES
ncbi:MAG: ABC transporter permease subunit [Verrucomicrobiae bacterium]|nr:ABC transporter permease subunit [Verrucomicrobiae bacterium]